MVWRDHDHIHGPGGPEATVHEVPDYIYTGIMKELGWENYVKLVEGYNLSGAGIVDVAKWPWTTRYQSGWTYATPQPTGLPYVDGSYTYGYEPGGSNPAYDAELAS